MEKKLQKVYPTYYNLLIVQDLWQGHYQMLPIIFLKKKLRERFVKTYKFSNHNNNKLILLLRKGVYLYEYMDDWEKFNETSLPEKENFYSHLNLEDITDADYAHTKRVCKDF